MNSGAYHPIITGQKIRAGLARFSPNEPKTHCGFQRGAMRGRDVQSAAVASMPLSHFPNFRKQSQKPE
jgi:hypothetical protein